MGYWYVIKPFMPLIIGVLVVMAFVGVLWAYGSSKFDAGYAKATAIYEPKLKICAADRDMAIEANAAAAKAIDHLKAAYGDLEAAVKMLEARERAAKLRGDRLAAELAAKEREHIQEAERLRAIVNAPKLAPAEACAGADLLLTEEARLRVGRIRQ